MSNWNAIRRNRQISGSFSGKSQKEQDDYYAFFSNDRPRFLHYPKIMRAFTKYPRLAETSGRSGTRYLSDGIDNLMQNYGHNDARILRRTIGRFTSHQR